ncbi:AcrR family transcriptional regulator [Crossiella equi]|uniref:AcrR family transcriptional regulator n=1 Tax=Crossiella equi TaxID=130796 RepID=A0ABS5A452_9PSEU|nr:TetR/AcrR family transcriptional regulator [Crossiella equi]MBP2471345.1 AcrR family transcriptional regulator [Crossiella equi]
MPKRVDHEQRRAEIAEAVLRIASTRGIHAASMREVAAEAGVSLRLVQYYFHTKEELMVGSMAHLTTRMDARLRERIRAAGLPPTPRSVLYAALPGMIPTDEEMYRIQLTYVAFQGLMISDPTLATKHFGTGPNLLESYLASQIKLAQDNGEIPADHDPSLTATTLVALTGGLAVSVVAGQRDGESAQRVVLDYLDRLFTTS